MQGARGHLPRSGRLRILDPAEAARLVRDGDTVVVTGGGGGVLEADELLAVVEARFEAEGSPRDLTLVHALGFGDCDRKGLNRFAHEGMVRRVIGGHWGWTPRMQALASEEKIEAYILPGGVVSTLLREIGAGRPGLITRTGLGTFADPRRQGGRCNARAAEPLTELIVIGGEEYLRYRPFRVDVALIKATLADTDGNLSLEEEPADLDTFAMAIAAHNCGGRVVAQVREVVASGALDSRRIVVPGALVDAVIVAPAQRQSYYSEAYVPAIGGRIKTRIDDRDAPAASPTRRIVAERAYEELRPGAILNFGFGMATAVANLIDERGETDRYWITMEHGHYGGQMFDGPLFGVTISPEATISMPEQFDFYSGGGIDITFLGMAELDAKGNVNVSHLEGRLNGTGGFIDIAQNARKVVFCGAFDAKGSAIRKGEGRLAIDRHGSIPKLVPEVEWISFSGERAHASGQEVAYVTERAVFGLGDEGLELREVAPGIDLKADVLDRLAFTPVLRDVKAMNPAYFR